MRSTPEAKRGEWQRLNGRRLRVGEEPFECRPILSPWFAKLSRVCEQGVVALLHCLELRT